jgi:two-component system chemotaxis response regulator CheB
MVDGRPAFPVVLIAASRGGLQATSAVLKCFPADFGAAVVVVQHRAELPGEAWTDWVRRATAMRVANVRPGEPLQSGTVYVAPATAHVGINAQGLFTIHHGHRIRGVLSAANPLFESAARHLGSRAIAVVLTGYGRDGTDGVQAINAAGGVVIAQDESTSRDFGMPRSAIGTGTVDFVQPIDAIGPLVLKLVEEHAISANASSSIIR